MSSQIIPVVPLSGTISGKQELTGSLTAGKTLSGQLSDDITRHSYNDLIDKPSINEVALQGDKSFEDLGLAGLSNQEIDKIIDDNGGMY